MTIWHLSLTEQRLPSLHDPLLKTFLHDPVALSHAPVLHWSPAQELDLPLH